MPNIQNFSVAAGNDQTVEIDITSADAADMTGATPTSIVKEQQFGVPFGPAIITKTGDGEIQVVTSPPKIIVFLNRDDTIDLLRNYYHEAEYVDADGNTVTVVVGIMTVTGTEIR